ncbi:MAG: tyrosine-type recombinase/integrase [Acidimicrobiales bacterium]
MPNKEGHRQFGAVRRLPSGRWQARYLDGAGNLLTAPNTFDTKRDAGRFLDAVRTDLERGTWIDPRAAKVTLDEYAKRWLLDRTDLRPRTAELYEGLLRNHILPALGGSQLADLTPSKIRSWHADLSRRPKPGASTTAKAYRLVRTILGTAVTDGLIPKNPCAVKGAGRERPPERPVATVDEVFRIADTIDPRFRLLVLLATFTGMRLGELQALKRGRVDLSTGEIRVVEQIQQLRSGQLVTGPPKTEAGVRLVTVPATVAIELDDHVRSLDPDPGTLVFAQPDGRPILRMAYYRAWRRATTEVGLNGLKPHDLRHTGNTLAAATGASTRELMARMGHSSPRAALIYQHATRERDASIARALDDLITTGRPVPTE